MHKGKAWYVIVAGIYTDRTAAKKALAAFPYELRKQSPWVKNIQSVQDILKKRQ